ncbi:MAG: sulfatase-like hydrolase/transferase [Reichenbachiella sp.]|uniref:sulfatase-like hydrolase/transferase n=1 Tax=Reichenbachiella sp. TaxID=2184521 RepID=UPI003264A474
MALSEHAKRFLIFVVHALSSNVFSQNKPNVRLIIADDLGVDLPMYGDSAVSVPELSSLVEEGILFKNAYVTQANCSPSRSSIITGLYPHQNGQLGLTLSSGNLVF